MRNTKLCPTLCVTFLALICFYCQASADSFGTLTTTLKKGQWMMSVEGYNAYGIAKRDLEYSNGTTEGNYWGVFHGRGYGLTDRINIFGKIGCHTLKVDPNPFKKEEESLKGGMTGGLYLKGALLKEPQSWCELGLGGGFLYCSAHHDNGPKYDWREWQIGSYVSKEFGRFSPYCGLKYSDLNSTIKFKQKEEDLSSGSIKVESNDKVGAFCGANIYLNKDKDVYLNCEVNFISSLEIGTGLYYKF